MNCAPKGRPYVHFSTDERSRRAIQSLRWMQGIDDGEARVRYLRN